MSELREKTAERLRELSEWLLSNDLDMKMPAGMIDPAEAADELDRVEKERDEAVKALEFYANPEIWQPHPHGLAFERSDKGYVARSTLSLLKASRPHNREETDAENERIS